MQGYAAGHRPLVGQLLSKAQHLSGQSEEDLDSTWSAEFPLNITRRNELEQLKEFP